MSLQEIYTKIFLGLAGQGWERSVQANGGKCVFRNGEGCKCAVGHLILDDKYTPGMESMSISEVNNMGAFGVLLCQKQRFNLSDFMDLHDNALDARDMEARFRQYGKELNLVIPEIVSV